MRFLLVAMLLVLLNEVSCSATFPTPPVGPHVNEQPIHVPYLPPPARPEVIPPMPAQMQKPVWIDGEWQWKSHRWLWQPGRWEDYPQGAYFAVATTVRLQDGSLVFFPGTWHSSH